MTARGGRGQAVRRPCPLTTERKETGGFERGLLRRAVGRPASAAGIGKETLRKRGAGLRTSARTRARTPDARRSRRSTSPPRPTRPPPTPPGEPLPRPPAADTGEGTSRIRRGGPRTWARARVATTAGERGGHSASARTPRPPPTRRGGPRRQGPGPRAEYPLNGASDARRQVGFGVVRSFLVHAPEYGGAGRREQAGGRPTLPTKLGGGVSRRVCCGRVAC